MKTTKEQRTKVLDDFCQALQDSEGTIEPDFTIYLLDDIEELEAENAKLREAHEVMQCQLLKIKDYRMKASEVLDRFGLIQDDASGALARVKQIMGEG